VTDNPQNVVDTVVPADVPTLPVVDVRKGMFGGGASGDTSGYGGIVRLVEFPAPAQRPYGAEFDDIADELDAALADDGLSLDVAVEAVVIQAGEITFHVRAQHLLAFVTRLRDEPSLRFEICTGVSGVHYPHMTGREFHAVWHFLSITHNRRVMVEVAVPDTDAHIPSIVDVYPSNDWHEREAFDMFGIVFEGHPDLTRILMPEDWHGHPLRKDYDPGRIPVQFKGANA